MKGKATFLGHPIHPMLIVLPLGLLPAATVCDFIFLFQRADIWAQMAFRLVVGGVAGGLLAGIFGFIDWLSIPAGTRAKRIGALHAIMNVVVLFLFAWSWLLRLWNNERPSGFSVTLGVIALLLALASGWFGAELIYRLNIGVDEDAHPNASNSLTRKSARNG